jgi:hypothetical protein
MQNEVNNDGCGFRGVAKYKGITVAMKEVRFSSRKPKELTRETKLEMKTMKELRNDNVNNFMVRQTINGKDFFHI